MRRACIGSTAGIFFLFLSTFAHADPPMGVGAAFTGSGFECFYNLVVGPPGNFTPFLDGLGIILTSTVENTKFVVANSRNGNQNLTCHGRAEAGTTVTGTDFFGFPATGTLVEDGCDALDMFLPGVCNGNGAAVLTSENSGGGECELEPGVFTTDWRQITTPGGRVTLSCQAADN